jgi:hypothetical protein
MPVDAELDEFEPCLNAVLELTLAHFTLQILIETLSVGIVADRAPHVNVTKG